MAGLATSVEQHDRRSGRIAYLVGEQGIAVTPAELHRGRAAVSSSSADPRPQDCPMLHDRPVRPPMAGRRPAARLPPAPDAPAGVGVAGRRSHRGGRRTRLARRTTEPMDHDAVEALQMHGQDIPQLPPTGPTPARPPGPRRDPRGEGTALDLRQLLEDTAPSGRRAGTPGRGSRGQGLLHADNCPELVLAWLACATVGAVGVTTNTKSVPPSSPTSSTRPVRGRRHPAAVTLDGARARPALHGWR